VMIFLPSRWCRERWILPDNFKWMGRQPRRMTAPAAIGIGNITDLHVMVGSGSNGVQRDD
jgi:hypothetical protein